MASLTCAPFDTTNENGPPNPPRVSFWIYTRGGAKFVTEHNTFAPGAGVTDAEPTGNVDVTPSQEILPFVNPGTGLPLTINAPSVMV